jgi:hypothetical protein
VVRGACPEASGDPDDDDVDFGERVTHRGRSQSTVVLSDSSSDNDDATTANQPTRGDANVASSRDREEEEWRGRLEDERRSNLNTERASWRPEMEARHSKGPAGETLAPSPPASADKDHAGDPMSFVPIFHNESTQIEIFQ